MKKILFSLLFIFVGVEILSAQDCAKIVLPKVWYNQEKLDQMPLSKVDYFCRLSKNSFFFVDEVPSDAEVYTIDVLVRKIDGEHFPLSTKIDLNTLSFFEYNFDAYQKTFSGRTVYFITPNSSHRYLALRSYQDAMTMTGETNNALDE